MSWSRYWVLTRTKIIIRIRTLHNCMCLFLWFFKQSKWFCERGVIRLALFLIKQHRKETTLITQFPFLWDPTFWLVILSHFSIVFNMLSNAVPENGYCSSYIYNMLTFIRLYPVPIQPLQRSCQELHANSVPGRIEDNRYAYLEIRNFFYWSICHLLFSIIHRKNIFNLHHSFHLILQYNLFDLC